MEDTSMWWGGVVNKCIEEAKQQVMDMGSNPLPCGNPNFTAQ